MSNAKHTPGALDNSALRVVLHLGDWHVVGGYLPRGTSWAMFDSESDARAEAWQLAQDMDLEYVP